MTEGPPYALEGLPSVAANHLTGFLATLADRAVLEELEQQFPPPSSLHADLRVLEAGEKLGGVLARSRLVAPLSTSGD